MDKYLNGGDLRSLGDSKKLIKHVSDQNKFDKLFKYLYHDERIIVMRAADAIEKITIDKPSFLNVHKDEIIELCKNASGKELKWHLALIIPRLDLSEPELVMLWQILTNWLTDINESKIVRVNSMQGLYELLKKYVELRQEFDLTTSLVEKENIPSLNARLRILKKLESRKHRLK